VSEAVAAIALGKWGVGDEFFGGSALAEKRGRVADHEFESGTVWVIEGPDNAGG
jgi:hypothetical protein